MMVEQRKHQNHGWNIIQKKNNVYCLALNFVNLCATLIKGGFRGYKLSEMSSRNYNPYY